MSTSTSEDELQEVYHRANSQDRLGKRIARAIELIEGVLDDLGEEAIAISFNGGKDCTVLLHLFAAVLYARQTKQTIALPQSHSSVTPPASHGTHPNSQQNGHTSPSTSSAPSNRSTQSPPPSSTSTSSSSSTQQTFSPTQSTSSSSPPSASTTHHTPSSPSTHPYPPIRSIYITSPNPFPALEAFVLESANRYNLDLYRFGGGMKSALSEYLGCGGGRGLKAVLVGTRRGDPNGDVGPLAPTDPSWPAFLRVHPILDWTYHDVWDFLREMDVRWCSLYDEGYTSLGSTINTVPNPLLRNPSGGWEPAWKLEDESQERAGRLDTSS